MKTYMVLFFTGVCCFAISGSVCIADSQRCEKAIGHIGLIVTGEDLAFSKLLIDHALESNEALGCSTKQEDALVNLRKDIYMLYIVDRLRIAKKDVMIDRDGRKALQHVAAAIDAAKEIDLVLTSINGLGAAALFLAACQDLEDAEVAGKDGDSDTAAYLQKEAAEFLRRALTLDDRVAILIKQRIRQ